MVQLIHAVLLWSSYLQERLVILIVCNYKFHNFLLDLLSFCFVDAVFTFKHKGLAWIHGEFNIRFNQCGLKYKTDLFVNEEFFLIGFHSMQGRTIYQQLQGLELQEKEEKDDIGYKFISKIIICFIFYH